MIIDSLALNLSNGCKSITLRCPNKLVRLLTRYTKLVVFNPSITHGIYFTYIYFEQITKVATLYTTDYYYYD